MPAAIETLGYKTRTAAVVALHSEGLSFPEIAAKIGITPDHVKSLHYAHYNHRSARSSMYVDKDVLSAFRAPAKRRGIEPRILAARILEEVAKANLVDAVLDDLHDLPKSYPTSQQVSA